MDIDWKDVSVELPELNTDVLIWIGCEKCRNGENHCHQCVAAAWNFPESFQRGRYCKGVKGDFYADRYSTEMQENYWSPCKPTHWAYVSSPFKKD